MARQNKVKYFSETLPYRNRNPLNIRFTKTVKWQGQKGEWQGYVRFMSFEYGYRAAVKIIRYYQQHGIRSMGGIISHWASSRTIDATPAIEAENYVSRATVASSIERYVKSVVLFMNARRCDPTALSYSARSRIDLHDRKATTHLLMAMTQHEMGANTTQLRIMQGYAEWGYDKAVTAPDFFHN